jgi:hypothetical protein
MKGSNKNSILIALVAVFVMGFAGPNAALAFASPLPVNLLSTSNYVILSETGITDANLSTITGNIGSYPITGAAVLVTCPEVTGTIYSSDAAGPLPCRVTNGPTLNTAVNDMVNTVYGDAAGRAPDATGLGAGIIGGMTFAPGVYKWSTDVTIPTSITLSGGPDDVWIFQIAGNLSIASAGSVVSGIKVLLSGGAQPSNIFWQVGGGTGATLGTYSTFNGNILSAKQIIIQHGAVLNGRALAQTQVTLDANTVSVPVPAAPIIPGPATLHVEKIVVNTSGGTAVPSNFLVYVKNVGVDVGGSPAAGTSTPGTLYSLAAGNYVISENANASYTKIFGGDCDSNGNVALSSGDNKTCTIVNTDIPIPTPVAVTGSSNYWAPLPLINVTKIPSPLTLPSGPGSVTYTYTVTNVGKVAMGGIWVKDNKCTPVSYVSGDTNSDSKLDIDETWVYRCTKTVSQTETNAAVAHGNANGWDGYDNANATVVVGSSVTPPLIHVVKKPNVFILPAGGGAVTYSYTVTNPGTAPLSNVSITDDKCTGLPGRVVGHPGDLNKNNLLESNEAWSFTCQTNLTKTTTNIGTAVGYANGLSAVDVSPATVAVATPSLPNTGFPEGKGITRAEAVAAFHRSLSIGAQGADVEALQTALEQKGFLTMPNGVAKGYFGSLTRAAVAKYQANAGLPSKGLFGPLTTAKLLSELGE